MNKPPKYCHHKRDRHGGPGYWYFSKPGLPPKRLHGLPWSPQFMADYEEASSAAPLPIGAKNAQPGTMAALIAGYYSSSAWRDLALPTQEYYRRVIEEIRDKHGAKQVKTLKTEDIRSGVARIENASSARRFLTVLRLLLEYGVCARIISVNPATGLKSPKVKLKGYHTWTEEEIERFESKYALGTRERLAFALLLYTGLRRSDIVRVGPQHIRNGRLNIVPSKTRKAGTVVDVPVHPGLASIISVSGGGHLAFIVTKHGAPFTPKGFSNWMRELCDAAGLPECSSHGLRKAMCRRLAEAGASAHEIMACAGHVTLQEAERYCREADKKKLAQSGQAKIIAAFPRFEYEE